MQRKEINCMAGVGTRKVFEDDRVIVWHLDLEPGQQGERHTHKLDYVVRVLSGSTLEVAGPRESCSIQLNLNPAEP
jgi:quercetin dioxygenase-like cupin family protein